MKLKLSIASDDLVTTEKASYMAAGPPCANTEKNDPGKQRL